MGDPAKRREMVEQSAERLRQMARRAAYERGLSRDKFVMVCIQVDDPRWRYIVDQLMPGADWQRYRDRGEEPVARGSVTFAICEEIGEHLPDLVDALMEVPAEGYVKLIALGWDGATVYDIILEDGKVVERSLN